MRRILLVLVVAAMVAVAIWLPRQEDVAADARLTEMPLEVGFRAQVITPTPPFVEGWTLAFPDVPPASQMLTLQVGALQGTTANARLTAVPGDAKSLLDRIGVVFGGAPETAVALPPATALDLQLELLGDGLSVGRGDGETVIAGAFIATPPGQWRAYRMTIGAGGPECVLGISSDRSAVLLPLTADEGPAILARFRSLLAPGPAAS